MASCNETNSDYALKWTNTIKSKILEDINIPIDSTYTDSSIEELKEVTCFNKGIRTRIYRINTFNGDTLVSIFYSKDQNFEIVRELCPNLSPSFEVVRYRAIHMGSVEFRYCNGKLKMQGFRYDDDTAVWKEWDENGKLVKETNHGNEDKLSELSKIHYYR